MGPGRAEACHGGGVGGGDVFAAAEGLGGPQLARVAFVVEEDELFGPAGEALGLRRGEAEAAGGVAGLVEGPGRGGGGSDTAASFRRKVIRRGRSVRPSKGEGKGTVAGAMSS